MAPEVVPPGVNPMPASKAEVETEIRASISDQIRDIFHEAVMESASRTLTTADDWAEARQIIEDTERTVDQANQRYSQDYDSRVDQVRAGIMDGTIALDHDLPGPLGRAPVTQDTIDAAAHGIVQRDHQGDLQRIKTQRTDNLSALQDAAEARDQARDMARNAFNDVNDRRSVADRRAPTRNR